MDNNSIENDLLMQQPFFRIPIEELEELSNQNKNSIPFKPFSNDGYAHEQNLAEILEESVLDKIASDLLEEIEEDSQSVSGWVSALAESFKLLGLKNEKVALPFPGASGVYSTMAIQSVIEFIATAASELLPSQGPAREEQLGETNDETDDKAQRIEEWFNIFLTQIDQGYYSDFRAMLFWVAWAGMAIRKGFYDPHLNRPTSKFIKPENFIVNYNTSSLYDCFRMTEVLVINSLELWSRQKSGMYRDLDLRPYDNSEDSAINTVVEDAVDSATGQSKPDYNKKIEYKLYECRTYLNLKDYNINNLNTAKIIKETTNLSEDESLPKNDVDKKFLPYVITIDTESKKILGFYNDWDKNDPQKNRKDTYVVFGYAQGPGFYKLGAAQLIGGMAETASNLLRNTVNGLYLSNMPGGLYAKGTRLENNNLMISPGQFVPIDTGGLSINDIFTTMPYKEPSPHINELCKELETRGSRLMGTVNNQLPDFNPNSPVGTTYAVLDVINLIQSEVMRSLRESMASEFKLFFNLFKEYLPDEPYHFNKVGGKSYISSQDFIDSINIVPVADAYVTSKIQRQMQSMAVLDRVAQFPQFHDTYEALYRYYKAMKVENIDKILIKPQETPPLDPITENMNLIMGKAAVAALEQNHEAHIMTHSNSELLNNPNPQIVANTQAHIQEHIAMSYKLRMQQTMGIMIPANAEKMPINQQNEIALMASQATQQIMSQQQQQSAPPPLDPAVVMLEEVKVKAQQTEDKAKYDAAKIELEKTKLELEKAKIDLEKEKIELEKAKISNLAIANDEKIRSEAFKSQLAYNAKLKEIAAKENNNIEINE